MQLYVRLYPGRDDDIISWLSRSQQGAYGEKRRRILEALRLGMQEEQRVRGQAGVDELRQAVEEALGSPVVRAMLESVVAAALAQAGVVLRERQAREEDLEVTALLDSLGADLLFRTPDGADEDEGKG